MREVVATPMVQSKPVDTSSPSSDTGRLVMEDHARILALYRLYLDSPPDSRQGIVDELLHQLASHVEKGTRLLRGMRESEPQGKKLLGDIEREHEKVNAMILKLQQSETDDDQALDEFFENLMQSVQVLFSLEERV
jgi:hypothetical protein